MARNNKYNYYTGVSIPGIDFENKEQIFNYHVNKMFNVVSGMLKIDGLPDTMPERDIKRLLQSYGFIAVVKPELTGGKLYAFTGGLGGEPNPYYMPTICTIANPALNFSKACKIGEDCVIVRHDSFYNGLSPIIQYYASCLTEHEISLYIADINARIPAFISAGDSGTYESAKQFVKDIKAGKLGIVNSSEFFDGIKTAPYSQTGSNGTFSQMIEYEQYLKAGFYNEIGVNANYNMKRESLNSAESQLNDDALLPLVDDIIKNVKQGFDEVNAKFDTNIVVSLDGVWKDRQTIQNNQINDTGVKNDDSNEPTTNDI